MAGRIICGLKYSTSAIERIRQLEADNIIEFFAGIPRKGVIRAVSIIPEIPGFRPNSEQEINKKVHLLANRLVRGRSHKPEDAQRDFDVLCNAWIMWGIENLGDASTICDYIDRSEKEERNIIDDGDEKAKGDEQLVIELFERLHDLSHSNRCRRTDVKKFFEFSPFSETENLRRIIESCKPAAEVAHDKILSKLPKKFERAEQEFAILSKIVDSLSESDKAHRETHSALRKDVDSLQKVTSDSSESALQLRNRLDEVLKGMAAQEKKTDEEVTTRRKQVQSIAMLIEKLQGDLAEITDHVNPLIERIVKADEAVMSITTMLDQIHELMIEIRATVNCASTVEKKIITEVNSSTTEVGKARKIVIEKLRREDCNIEPAELRQGEDLVNTVATNFESLKIKKSSAEALALECLAALIAGQIPHFAGVHGRRVAEACAVALAGNNTYILTVPVGISAPIEFRRQLDSMFTNEKQEVGCVIIEGINRSAFDTFGECLVEIISRQRSGECTSRSLLLMATLTDGPASLPLSVAHISLGPVFYTDALDWRLRHQKEVKMTDGVLSTKKWGETYVAAERSSPVSDEVSRLLNAFAPTANPLLRETIFSGLHALSALQNENSDLTELQSLAFGWLAPICVVMRTSAEVVDQEFDQVNLDGTKPDKRLENLLRSNIFDNAQRGDI